MWAKTPSHGLKCKVFGKEPIDGCKPGFKSYLANYHEDDVLHAFGMYSKKIDLRRSCESSAWNHHYHFGCYGNLSIPSQQVTDHTMTQRTWEITKQYILRQVNGHQLSVSERDMLKQATEIYDRTVKLRQERKRHRWQSPYRC